MAHTDELFKIFIKKTLDTTIGINNPSNCKADTKNKGYQEIMFFVWKIQIEKIQLTRDLKDNTKIYQEVRLPFKNDQGY